MCIALFNIEQIYPFPTRKFIEENTEANYIPRFSYELMLPKIKGKTNKNKTNSKFMFNIFLFLRDK
jgi:hypothetical protein